MTSSSYVLETWSVGLRRDIVHLTALTAVPSCDGRRGLRLRHVASSIWSKVVKDWVCDVVATFEFCLNVDGIGVFELDIKSRTSYPLYTRHYVGQVAVLSLDTSHTAPLQEATVWFIISRCFQICLK